MCVRWSERMNCRCDERIKNAPYYFTGRWLIPQRMPTLNRKAAEFADKGYSVADVDPLTGAQRFAIARFDDQGQLFGVTPEQMTDELRGMLQYAHSANAATGDPGMSQLDSYHSDSLRARPKPHAVSVLCPQLETLQRGAIAPLWEVQTAKMRQDAGDPNAAWWTTKSANEIWRKAA